MDESLEIKYFFNNDRNDKEYQIKTYPTDFIVQEIDLDGEICDKGPIFNLQKYIKSIDLLIWLYKENRTDEDILFWLDNYKTNSIVSENLKLEYNKITFIPLNIKNRELRTKLHNILNYNFSITTKTVDENFIVKKDDSHTFNFVLNKVMMNTVDACKMIERNLGTSVSFAGNKDKKAVTYQKVSLRTNIINLLEFVFEYTGVSKEDYNVVKIYKYMENVNIQHIDYKNEISDSEEDFKRKKFNYVKSSINIYNIRKGHNVKLGDLKGNKFTIKIRNEKNLNYKNIENGFINYFGKQRFGKASNNHKVGEMILNKEYEEACNLIIKNSKGYEDYKNGNIEECLKKCDNNERYIFKHIPNYKKIIFGLRRDIRMIYLHSYQSYLFNKEVNRLIENKSEETICELKKMNDKLLKGGVRKIYEKGYHVKGWQEEDDFVISFELKPSCYATMALREL